MTLLIYLFCLLFPFIAHSQTSQGTNSSAIILLVGFKTPATTAEGPGSCLTETVTTPGCYEINPANNKWTVYEAEELAYVPRASGSGIVTLQTAAQAGRVITDAIDPSTAVEFGEDTTRFTIYATPAGVVLGMPGDKSYRLNTGEVFEVRDSEGALILRASNATLLTEVEDLNVNDDLIVAGDIDSSLTANRCVQTTTNGVLATTSAACFDPTAVGAATTFGDGSQSTITWTWNLSGTDTVLTMTSAVGTFTGNFDASGRIQGSKVRISTTTCLDLSGDRIFHDTDCNGTKAAGEEFIDYKNTMLTQFCWAGEDVATATTFLRSDCSEAISGAATTDDDAQATRYGPHSAGVFRNLRCKTSANVAASTTYTYTFRVDGVDESLTCNITTGASTCEDTSNTETVAAAVRSSLKMADSTANDTTNRTRCTVEFHTE